MSTSPSIMSRTTPLTAWSSYSRKSPRWTWETSRRWVVFHRRERFTNLMSDMTPDLPMGSANFGDATERHQLRLPTANADGSIHLLPADGPTIARFPVKHLMHFYKTLHTSDNLADMMYQAAREKHSQMMFDAEILVTDARIIVHKLDACSPGKLEVAQLWYSWISLIEFRPKQSFLNDAIISLHYGADFPNRDAGTWFERLELTFDKTFHPGNVAWEITRRLAAHHLRLGPPNEVCERLIALTNPPILPDPPKGGFAEYCPPAYVVYPGGIPHVDTGSHIPWEWIVQQ